MYRLYEFPSSGNCYKARLLLAHLAIAYERVLVDIVKGEGRAASHRARNPNGRTPTLELPDGTFLWESNAILCYLADGSDYVPTDRLARARMLQWMFFEQYSHEPYIATARFWLSIKKEPEHPAARLAERHERGHEALAVMEGHLARHAFFAGDRYSVADIALYAYTHVGAQGGFDLGRYPAIVRWLDAVRAQPGHVTIEA